MADVGAQTRVARTGRFQVGDRVTVIRSARDVYFILAYQYHVTVVDARAHTDADDIRTWLYWVVSDDFFDESGPCRIGPLGAHQLERGWVSMP